MNYEALVVEVYSAPQVGCEDQAVRAERVE